MSGHDFLQRQEHKNISSRVFLVLLIFITAVMTLPALGVAPFSTKGEPREAIVAMQMLESGDWILPPDSNGDIPYKPPMLYWAMALSTYLPAYSPEFSFRLPSALALLGLVCMTFWFTNAFATARHTSRPFRAFLTGLVLLTSSEIIRAGVNARVDMVNTFFMVGAMMSFFRWFYRHSWLSALSAVICMSGAVLTKGPVGILLPGFIGFIFAIRSGHGVVSSIIKIFLAAVLSCILPGLWYCAAYQRGGQAFLDLVYEENFGRFLGSMSYSSHEKGLWYYFAMLPAGCLPWSLLALFSLFSLKNRRIRNISKKIRQLSPADFFALTAAAAIFIFYCIPKSKRGVYLLPMYPFVAYMLADWIIILIARGKRSPLVFCSTIGVVSLVAGMSILIAPFLHLSPQIQTMLPPALSGILPVGAAAIGFFTISRRNKDNTMPILGACLSIAILYLSYFVFINPRIAVAKSDKCKAEAIAGVVPPGKLIYAHNPSRLDRWYSISYYLYGRIVPAISNANYSSYAAPYDTPDEAARIGSLLAQDTVIYYLTSASQRGSETMNRIGQMADTVVVYESATRSADLKERPVVYEVIRRPE